MIDKLTLDDPRYPVKLKEIPDPPKLLFVKAKTRLDTIDLEHTIAVVGTRHMTKYGAEVTRKLVRQLVANGFTIVSGMANGVDTVAHEAAIEAGWPIVRVETPEDALRVVGLLP